METTMVVSQPTETPMVKTEAAPAVQAQTPPISGKPEDFQKDIQALAKEMGMVIGPDGNAAPVSEGQERQEPTRTHTAPAQAQPEPPQAAPVAEAQTPVPEKFKTPDGHIDESKVVKSAANAEAALRKALALEAELRKAQNRVRDLKAGQPEVTPASQQAYPSQSPTPGQPPLTAEAINQALAEGKNPGDVIMRVSSLAYAQAKADAVAEVRAELQELKARQEDRERTAELEKIAETDPWVFTEEGIKRLVEIRQANPHLNSAQSPWQEAYEKHLAQEYRSQRSGLQVQTPIPIAPTAKAPPTPVGAANRGQAQGPNLAALSGDQRQLNAFLDTMSPEQQTAFWKSVLPGAK